MCFGIAGTDGGGSFDRHLNEDIIKVIATIYHGDDEVNRHKAHM